jgi:putative phosphoesterase
VSDNPFRVRVLADSHGHLCDETLEVLSDADLILHAGDIGGESILDRLRALAPVVAVVGNGDPDLARRYPWEQRVEVAGSRLLLCHWYDNWGRVHPKIEREIDEWDPRVLVYGHTHVADNTRRGGRLYFNPGYAGPPGLGRRRSVGRLLVGGGAISSEIVDLSG